MCHNTKSPREESQEPHEKAHCVSCGMNRNVPVDTISTGTLSARSTFAPPEMRGNSASAPAAICTGRGRGDGTPQA